MKKIGIFQNPVMRLTRHIKISLACRFEMTRQAAFVGAYRLILIVEAQLAVSDRREISLENFVVDLGKGRGAPA